MPTHNRLKKRKSRYHTWGGAEAARYHVVQRYVISRRFAGIDKDIEREFYNLPNTQIEKLFALYGQAHGSTSESYARNTFKKWKSGKVKMSGQTAERLIELLPPFLSFEIRYELIRKLRMHYITPVRIEINTTVFSWREVLTPAIERVVERTKSTILPLEVQNGASWLANNDGKYAQEILIQVEEEESKIRTSYLENEFKSIEIIIERLKNSKITIKHTILIPNGIIELNIKSDSTRQLAKNSFKIQEDIMEKKTNDESLIEISRRDLISTHRRENLLDIATDSLTDEERTVIRRKALNEKLNLDASAREADDKFFNASRDMANDVRVAQELDRTQGDYTINATHDTPSGRTNININRTPSRNNVVIWVSIAVVILVLVIIRYAR